MHQHGDDLTNTQYISATVVCDSTDMSRLVRMCAILINFLAVAEKKSLPWYMTVWNLGLLN